MNFAKSPFGRLARRGPVWTAFLAVVSLGWLPAAGGAAGSIYNELQQESPFGTPPPQVTPDPGRGQRPAPTPQVDFTGYSIEGDVTFISFAPSRRGGRGGPTAFEVAVGQSANGVEVVSFDPRSETVTVRFNGGGGGGGGGGRNRGGGGGGNQQELSLKTRDLQARGMAPQTQAPLVVYSPFDTGGNQQGGGRGQGRGRGQGQGQGGGGGQNNVNLRGQGGGGGGNNVVAAGNQQGGRGNNNNNNAQGQGGQNNNNNVQGQGQGGGRRGQGGGTGGGGGGGRNNQATTLGATNSSGLSNSAFTAPTFNMPTIGGSSTSSDSGANSAQQRRRIVSPTGQ